MGAESQRRGIPLTHERKARTGFDDAACPERDRLDVAANSRRLEAGLPKLGGDKLRGTFVLGAPGVASGHVITGENLNVRKPSFTCAWGPTPTRLIPVASTASRFAFAASRRGRRR